MGYQEQQFHLLVTVSEQVSEIASHDVKTPLRRCYFQRPGASRETDPQGQLADLDILELSIF